MFKWPSPWYFIMIGISLLPSDPTVGAHLIAIGVAMLTGRGVLIP